MKKIYVASLIGLGIITSASAEGIQADKVEVVSQTPLATLGVPVDEVPANVQVAKAKNIEEQQPQSLADFVNENLGSVNISNGTGSPVQPDVEYRGFIASPQLGQPIGLSVYVDGVRFNEAFGDIVNWDLIPMNAISNINLMPGSNPLFGLNTLGGALAVTLKNGEEFQGTSATLSGGSWGGKQFQFETGGVIKDYNLDYYVAGNFFDQQGWRPASQENVNQVLSKLRWHNDASALELTTILANNDIHQAQTLPISMASLDRRQIYTGPDWVKNQMAFFNLKGNTFLSDTKLLEGNIYFKRSNSQSINSNGGIVNNPIYGLGDNACGNGNAGDGNTGYNCNIDGSNTYGFVRQSSYGLSGQLSFLNDVFNYKNRLTVGAAADFSRVNFVQNTYIADLVNKETVNSFDTGSLQDNVTFKSTTDSYAVYLTDTVTPITNLNLTGSARYNVTQVHLAGLDSNYDNSSSTDLAGNHTYNRLNPALGVTYSFDPSLNIYGGYNEAMRAPNALELECADPNRPCALPTGFTGDPALKMVVAKTWEGGLRGHLRGDWRWNAGAFVTNTTNDIEYVYSSGSITQGFFQNVGSTKRQGVEVGLSGKVYDVNLHLHYSYVDATYQSSFQMGTSSDVAGVDGVETVNKGNHIPGIAKNTLKLRADTNILPDLNVGATAIFIGSQWAHGNESNLDPQGRIPGYAVVNLDAHYKINSHWNMFAKVTNLFDKEYSTYGIFSNNIYATNQSQADPQLFITPAAPRAAWVGITYNFGGRSGSSSSVDND
jgi:iron complex outermembrane recepter protein